MIFYDFEVYAHDWLVCCADMDTEQELTIVNDREKLQALYDSHKYDIWAGFNNRHYDQYIMKAILLGFDPKKVNDYIIRDGRPGYRFSSLFNDIHMVNYDVMLKGDRGLKSFEGFMGHDIKETSVPFDLDRRLTEEEIQETVEYCMHDVEETIQVFLARKSEFDAVSGLIRIFHLPMERFEKTKAQLVAEICGGKGESFDDSEFAFPLVPCLENLRKYRYVLKWYRDPENHDYSKSLEIDVSGIRCKFAWGGLHGAMSKRSGKGIFLSADVTSYYPSIQIQYHFGYRNMSAPQNFERIHRENLRYKREGNGKARLPYKVADNSMSGQLKDRNSRLYDPMMNNAVCVNGQLMLLMLIEMLEGHAELVQANTDGVLLRLYSMEDFDTIDDIVWNWEQMTGMNMEFSFFDRIFQKDVNNYILVDEVDGNVKTKGGYVKKLSDIDYDLPIINKALIEYMVNDVPVEDTINGCKSLREFQLILPISSKYSHILYGDKRLKEKCIRIFASRNESDPGVKKVHAVTKRPARIPNSPDHCFLVNDDVTKADVPERLDREWYIRLARRRLRDFGC